MPDDAACAVPIDNRPGTRAVASQITSQHSKINNSINNHRSHNLQSFVLVLAAAALMSGVAGRRVKRQPHPTDTRADDARNVRLVGYNDLQGREALVVTTLSDAANGSWVYVGHHESYWDQKPKPNPITGKDEWNGTSILNVADPRTQSWCGTFRTTPTATRAACRWSTTTSSTARARLPDSQFRNPHRRRDRQGPQVPDLRHHLARHRSVEDHARLRDHRHATQLLRSGLRRPFTHRAHKGWWSQDTGYFYAASGEPGFRNVVIQIFDLKDPKAPKFIGRAWLPSQKDGEPGYEGQYAHHPVVDEQRKRLYVGYRNSGWTAEFDIADPAHPKLVWSLDMNPPHRGPHTVSPIVYDTVPNFGKEALPRRYAFVVDEAGGAADMSPCPGGVRAGSYMLDITNETKPFPVSVWQVPVGNFCNKGGRFGPHQSAETVNGRINRFENKIAWLAYFNAGIRVLDLSDPYQMKELGYYIPKTNERSHPIAMGQPTAIQINDVDIDSRGLAYASDRVGTGLFILEYKKPN